MTTNLKGNRISFISFLQFIGVISVIFGHSMNSIDVPAFLTVIKAWIYTWHMPLFFFVSAFLFSYKGGYDQGYKHVVSRRFQRLIVPYLIWNACFFLPKYLLGYSFDKSVEISLSYVVHLVLCPRENILGHTWFLCALFEMYLVAILLDRAKKHKELWVPIILVLSIINCYALWNPWFAISDLMKNGIFFWCGLIIGNYSPSTIEDYFKRKWTVLSTILIVVGTTIVWIFDSEMSINTLVLGFSVLMIIICCQVLSGMKLEIIEFVSKNSFPIYIMHWPVIMVLRLVFYQRLGLPPMVCFIINLIFGLVLPCLIAAILRTIRVSWIKRLASWVFGI